MNIKICFGGPMAEAEGFEPSEPFLIQHFSRVPLSTTQARFRLLNLPYFANVINTKLVVEVSNLL
ncbi:MAG: hypothetical protein UT50_C0017G0012 [Candidatus Moranbacteria bacterium GW2011_GWA2_39_41]|nr:MAG: hypothetical protein UT50_C0017G0012 [Candidatus Moranbacteria bacterium GW2011_GWA2_39_41]